MAKKANSEVRKTVQLVSALCITVFGCILIGVSLFLPPAGEIHPSVLAAFGEILTFAGAVIGIDYRYRAKKED